MDATTTGVMDDTSAAELAPVALPQEATTKPARVARSKQRTAPDVWLLGAVEAVLLSLGRPMSASKIADGLSGRSDGDEQAPVGVVGGIRPDITAAMVDDAVLALNAAYESSGRSFRIERVANGYRVMTLSAFVDAVARFHEARQSAKLSRAAIESLAIIAYKQPITRAHLEAIRGVNCGEVLKSLLERQLIVISGRSEELGRPMLYSTGPRFLTSFGLASIRDLPDAGEGGRAGEPGPNAQNPSDPEAE